MGFLLFFLLRLKPPPPAAPPPRPSQKKKTPTVLETFMFPLQELPPLFCPQALKKIQTFATHALQLKDLVILFVQYLTVDSLAWLKMILPNLEGKQEHYFDLCSFGDLHFSPRIPFRLHAVHFKKTCGEKQQEFYMYDGGMNKQNLLHSV